MYTRVIFLKNEKCKPFLKRWNLENEVLIKTAGTYLLCQCCSKTGLVIKTTRLLYFISATRVGVVFAHETCNYLFGWSVGLIGEKRKSMLTFTPVKNVCLYVG